MRENANISELIDKAKKNGADSVDVIFAERSSISASSRLAKLETIEKADVIIASVRVFVGDKSAVLTTDNIDDLRSDLFSEKAVAAAKCSPSNPKKIRAAATDLCKNFTEIDICDPKDIDHETLIESAKKCEDIALQIKGITNSEGAEAAFSRTKFVVARDDGFFEKYEKTGNSLSLSVLAEKNGDLERSYSFSNAVYHSDLKSLKRIANEAAEKTLRKLGARKILSCKVPVIFHRDVASSLLQSILSALNGAVVARGISFLKDKLSQKIFSDELNIIDQYDVCRGLCSKPFDTDGIACSNRKLIENGVLNSFLLNTKYAEILGMQSTGHASGWDSISPNNVCINKGSMSFDALVGDVQRGLYVTEVLGNGLNIVTGNYSQGACGFWIENGKITYPVNEITVAGNFIDMFNNCTFASDLEFEFGIDSPTMLFDEMVVGGI